MVKCKWGLKVILTFSTVRKVCGKRKVSATLFWPLITLAYNYSQVKQNGDKMSGFGPAFSLPPLATFETVLHDKPSSGLPQDLQEGLSKLRMLSFQCRIHLFTFKSFYFAPTMYRKFEMQT